MAHAPTRRPELRNSVFSKYNISEQVSEFPYDSEDEIFDVDQIVAAVRSHPAAHVPVVQPDNGAQEKAKGAAQQNGVKKLANT